MTTAVPSATMSLSFPRKIKSANSMRIYAVAFLCFAVSYAVPLKAWANRTILVEVLGTGSCHTLSITGNGWGKVKNHIAITAVGLPGVKGPMLIATGVPESGEIFSFSKTFSYNPPACSAPFVYATFTATGQHGNKASESGVAFQDCPINWAPC
jgi:hypothetical protein